MATVSSVLQRDANLMEDLTFADDGTPQARSDSKQTPHRLDSIQLLHARNGKLGQRIRLNPVAGHKRDQAVACELFDDARESCALHGIGRRGVRDDGKQPHPFENPPIRAMSRPSSTPPPWRTKRAAPRLPRDAPGPPAASWARIGARKTGKHRW